MTAPATPLVAVVGAHGGSGTSTVASALTHALRRATHRGVLLDLDPVGPGIEVLLGIEHEAGARWPELTEARGDVDGCDLLAALPRWGTVPVLSGTRHRPQAPDDDVVLDVCAALLRAGEPVVADLPRPGAWTPGLGALVADADETLVVAHATLTGAAGAVALARRFAGTVPGRVRLVVHRTRPGGPHADDLETLTGLAVAGEVRHDRSLAATLDRGDGPRTGRGTPLARLGAQLAAAVTAPQGTSRAPDTWARVEAGAR